MRLFVPCCFPLSLYSLIVLCPESGNKGKILTFSLRLNSYSYNLEMISFTSRSYNTALFNFGLVSSNTLAFCFIPIGNKHKTCSQNRRKGENWNGLAWSREAAWSRRNTLGQALACIRLGPPNHIIQSPKLGVRISSATT